MRPVGSSTRPLFLISFSEGESGWVSKTEIKMSRAASSPSSTLRKTHSIPPRPSLLAPVAQQRRRTPFLERYCELALITTSNGNGIKIIAKFCFFSLPALWNLHKQQQMGLPLISRSLQVDCAVIQPTHDRATCSTFYRIVMRSQQNTSERGMWNWWQLFWMVWLERIWLSGRLPQFPATVLEGRADWGLKEKHLSHFEGMFIIHNKSQGGFVFSSISCTVCSNSKAKGHGESYNAL